MKHRFTALLLPLATLAFAPSLEAQVLLGRPAAPVLLGRPVAPEAVRPAATRAAPSQVGIVHPRAPRGLLRIEPARLGGAVLAEANGARRRAGARALSTDPALARAARRYARELAERREIEHVSRTPGRRTFRDRIDAAGARARVAGENLARLTAYPEYLPERVVRAWLQSPGHRSNLLDPIFARTGIGVWLGSDDVWYIVQLYATPS